MNYIKIQKQWTDRCRKRAESVKKNLLILSSKSAGQLDNISIQRIGRSITNLGEKYGNKRTLEHAFRKANAYDFPGRNGSSKRSHLKRLMEHPFFVETRDLLLHGLPSFSRFRRIIEKAWEL